MSLPDFLRFDPVPVRGRHDGWSPALQRRFILALARGAGPAEAARQVGKTRQTAYALRRKPGAGSFAAAWNAAVDFAREARAAAAPAALTGCGLETMLVPRTYRGRIVGFVQREDTSAALRTLGQLDRVADRVARSGVDPELLYQALEAFEALAETVKTDKNHP